MFCPKCGAQTADQSAFCANCGNSLTAPVQPVQQPIPQPAPMQQPTQPTPAKAPMSKGVLASIIVSSVVILAAIVVLLVTLLGGGSKSGNDPVDVAEVLAKSVTESDIALLASILPEEVQAYVAENNHLKRDVALQDVENCHIVFHYYSVLGAEENDEILSLETEYTVGSDKEADDDTFEAVRDQYAELFDLEVTAVSQVEVEITFIVEYIGGLSTASPSEVLNFVEIDGVWYFDMLNAEMALYD